MMRAQQHKSLLYSMQQTEHGSIIADNDRVITSLPPPFLSQATPYTDTDFDPRVVAACSSGHVGGGSGGSMLDPSVKVAKVVILGDVGTGKTSLVHRFVNQSFDSNYKATIGVDFEVERLDVLGLPFNLQIWDTAGQERFRCIASSYYRGAQAVVVVCDVSNLSTLTHATQWLQDAQDANPANHRLIVVLAANKTDMVNASLYGLVEVKARQLCLAMGAEYWAVSAKSGEGVAPLFRRLAALLFQEAVLDEIGSEDKVDGIKIGDHLMCDANGNANTVMEKKRGCKDNNKCGNT